MMADKSKAYFPQGSRLFFFPLIEEIKEIFFQTLLIQYPLLYSNHQPMETLALLKSQLNADKGMNVFKE